MAISHNLVSCDESLHLSLFNRHHLSLPLAYGLTVEFDTLPDQYYVIERNNQAFFPYPSIVGDGAFIIVTLNSVEINGSELITSPISFNSTTEPQTAITGGATIPATYPTDYNVSTFVNTEYVLGTGYKIALTDAIQALIDSSGIQTIFVRRTTPGTPSVNGTPNSFSNFGIQKREVDSISVQFDLEIHPTIGSVVTDSVEIEFSESIASYKYNSVETNIAGFPAQSYVTTESAFFLHPFSFKTFEEVECPCELCDNCYLLTNCIDSQIWMQTYTDLADEVGNVIEIEGVDGCWKVSECPGKVVVEVKESYASCKGCKPKCNTPNCR